MRTFSLFSVATTIAVKHTSTRTILSRRANKSIKEVYANRETPGLLDRKALKLNQISLKICSQRPHGCGLKWPFLVKVYVDVYEYTEI